MNTGIIEGVGGITMETEKVQVCIETIAEQLEGCMDSWEQYLNVETGEFVALSDGTWVETDEELAEKIEFADCYVRLPNQYDIHEWHIMRKFAETLPVKTQQDRLLDVLHRPKAYRRFKDEIVRLRIAEVYYNYRFLTFCDIAKEWCEDNEIPYTYRENKEK